MKRAAQRAADLVRVAGTTDQFYAEHYGDGGTAIYNADHNRLVIWGNELATLEEKFVIQPDLTKSVPSSFILQLAQDVENQICEYMSQHSDYSPCRDSNRAMMAVADCIWRNWG